MVGGGKTSSAQKSICDFEPEQLIVEVESRPVLYDKTLAEYSNRSLKDAAWEEISELLTDNWGDVTAKQKSDICREVQLKWKHIRDNFRRELQGKCGKKRKRYRYYNQLTFLIPHVKDTLSSGSKTIKETARENDTLQLNQSRNAATSQYTTSRHHQQDNSNFEDEVLKFIKSDMIESDEDRTFCISLVPSLKKMDNITKLTAKIEILNTIRKLSHLETRDTT